MWIQLAEENPEASIELTLESESLIEDLGRDMVCASSPMRTIEL